MTPPKPAPRAVLTGAAFLMAVSAIGPGFLTQTATFTAQLGASLAFAILLSILIDVGAQLNTWRVLCVSRRRGNEVADAVIPGFGWVVTAAIVLGSLAFNVGNLGGCAIGLEALFGLPPWAGATASALVAVALFLLPQMLRGVDAFSKTLGVAMILMTLYVLFMAAPPLGEAARQAFWPDRIDVPAVVTLVGGTVGGYIMFSGAHRLLDAGIGGEEQVGLITWASVQGILITGLMRTVLFLAFLGIFAGGAQLSGSNRQVIDAFEAGAGPVGFYLSAVIFWSAAITSVVGCAYTSISFLRLAANSKTQAGVTIGYILLSLALMLLLNTLGMRPTVMLIVAGTVNGVLLPVILGVILVAAYRPSIMGSYRHPWWAGLFGLLAWVVTVFFAYQAVVFAVQTITAPRA
jgi:Mn2+/Fe2+ NRAMP family transporter